MDATKRIFDSPVTGSSDRGDGTYFNPVIWADVPDNDIIRVGDAYWMSSTTMHMTPGVPIMRSYDLVNWETVSYCYNVLEDIDAMKLQNGGNMYRDGTWASSLRYKNGIFYLIVPSNTTRKTYIFHTEDPVNMPWRRYEIGRQFHDCGLLMDDDGRNWLIWGNGAIYIIELNGDVTGLAENAKERVLLETMHAPDPETGITPKEGLAEGAHFHKINGMYYVTGITRTKERPRSQVFHRSKSLYGPWESKVVSQEVIAMGGGRVSGVAQGDIVEDGNGNWYAIVFRDSGAVGRLPWLMPVTWVNGWPMFGKDGSYTNIPREGKIPLKTDTGIKSVCYSDEFTNSAPKPVYYDSEIVPDNPRRDSDYSYNGSNLNLAWQWNHNPDNRYWSLTEREGWLRLRTGYISTNILNAPNTLTQRTFGPDCAAVIFMDTSNMKPGDEAGISLFTARYGSIGVKMEGAKKQIVTTLANGWSAENHGHTGDAGLESARVPLHGDIIYLKAEANFFEPVDTGYFYYSYDGKQWTKLGEDLQMRYSIFNHFMGYRFALYNFAKEMTGGFVDFDFMRLSRKH
jgi:beta-xylosidase